MSVKLVVSGGFGAGWSTWNPEVDPADEGLVALVERGAKQAQLEDYAYQKWPEAYLGGLDSVHVVEVAAGELYRFREYDGSESVEVFDANHWEVA